MSQEPSKPPTPRTGKRGRSLRWSDDDIDQAAEVGLVDADAVSAWWDRFAPKEARTLLDSREDDDAGSAAS